MFRRALPLLAALGLLASTAVVTGSPAPAGAASDGWWDYQRMSISGTYQTLLGEFGGSTSSADILFYAPGTTADSLWIGRSGERGSGGFTKRSLSVNGSYVPIIGDFAGDGHDEVFWYAPGTGPDSLWVNGGDANFTSQLKKVDGRFRPFRLIDYTSGKDSILWYNPSSTTSYRWRFSSSGDGTFTSTAVGVPANAKVVIGDWNGDGHEDAFALGASDKAVYFTAAGSSSKSFNLPENYTPITVYDYPSDGILWFGPGTLGDAYWRGTKTTSFTSVPLADVNVRGRLTSFGLGAVLVTGRDIEDGVFFDDTTSADWYDLNEGHEKGDERPIIGDFDGNEVLDILWYAAGSAGDELWYGEDTQKPAGSPQLAPHTRARD